MVETFPSSVGTVGSIPGWGAKIPHTLWPKNQTVKQKQQAALPVVQWLILHASTAAGLGSIPDQTLHMPCDVAPQKNPGAMLQQIQ